MLVLSCIRFSLICSFCYITYFLISNIPPVIINSTVSINHIYDVTNPPVCSSSITNALSSSSSCCSSYPSGSTLSGVESTSSEPLSL